MHQLGTRLGTLQTGMPRMCVKGMHRPFCKVVDAPF